MKAATTQTNQMALILRTCICFAIGIAAMAVPLRADGDPLDNWHVRYPVGALGVAYGNDRFVAVAGGYTPYCLVSTNGTDWKGYLSPESAMVQCLTFANGHFLLVLSRSYYSADSGTVLYSSTNGISWTLRNFRPVTGYGIPFARAGGGNGIFVATGPNLIMSKNLVDWTVVEQGSSGVREFAFGNGTIVGTPWGGSAFVASTDGLIWEYTPSLSPARFTDVSYCNGRFVAFGPAASDGAYPAGTSISTDAQTWSPTLLPDYTNAVRLLSGNDKFFLLNSGTTNGYFTSADGLSWEARSFGTNVQINGIAFGANTYVAVGDVILQSDPVTNPPAPSVVSIQTYPGITISGTPGQHYQIECTDSLLSTNTYQPLTNVVLTSNPFLWVDTTATNSARRFYRAVQVP